MTETTPADIPLAHSTIGGSVANRILNCSWYLANIHRAPPQPASFAADEGTALHTILELFYSGKLDAIQDGVGMTIAGVTLDEDQIERALDAARALDDYLDQLEEEIGAPVEIWLEQRVKFDNIPGAFGTCDVLVKCGYLLCAIDWKFGQNIVEVENNAQLLFYTQAARDTFPDLFSDCTHLELTIIQPAAYETRRTWKTLPERADLFERDLVAAIELSRQPNPTACTGDHCKYCSLEALCPAKQELARRALQTDVSPDDVETLVEWLNNCAELSSFVEAVQSFGHSLLEAGREVPGWKLVSRQGRRIWINEDDVRAFCRKRKVPKRDYEVTTILSPAKLEKLIRPTPVPEELWRKTDPGTTIAPMSDRRQDLNANNLQALRRLAES